MYFHLDLDAICYTLVEEAMEGIRTKTLISSRLQFSEISSIYLKTTKNEQGAIMEGNRNILKTLSELFPRLYKILKFHGSISEIFINRLQLYTLKLLTT